MATQFRCLICSELFDSLTDLEYHLEHSDDYHTQMVEKLGLRQCYQEITTEEDEEMTHSQEDLQGKEWSDYPKGTKIPWSGYPYKSFDYPKYSDAKLEKAYEYPYAPFYKEGQAFICTEHRFGTKDFKEYMKHMLQYHKDDFEDFLKHHVKQQVIHRLRYQRGSSEHLSNETLDRLVDSEIKELMIKAELTTKSNVEAFSGYVDTKFSELKDFLTAKTTICPLCHKDMEYHTEGNAYLSKKIIDSLKSGMQSLSKEDEKYYNKVVKRKYPAKWQAEDIDLCLRNTLHMHLSHGRIESLVKAKVLDGALPQWLASKGYENKQSKMNLSTLFPDSQESPSGKNLSKSDKILQDWLKKR